MTIREARTVVAGTIAGLLMFGWYSVAWMLPGHDAAYGELDNQHAVIATLTENGRAPTGTFFLNQSGENAVGSGVWGWMTLHRAEDYAFGSSIVGSLIQQLVLGLLLAILVRSSGAATFGRRFAIVALAALCAAIVGPITMWNWSWYSNAYAAMTVIDQAVGWAIGGLAIAAIASGGRRDAHVLRTAEA